MKEFVKELIKRLEEYERKSYSIYCEHGLRTDLGRSFGSKEIIQIVNQLSEEYNNGWIPYEFELPKYTGEYNVTVVVASELGSFEDVTTLRFENIKGKEPRWIIPKDDIYRVIAWQPLPAPYQKGE